MPNMAAKIAILPRAGVALIVVRFATMTSDIMMVLTPSEMRPVAFDTA